MVKSEFQLLMEIVFLCHLEDFAGNFRHKMTESGYECTKCDIQFKDNISLNIHNFRKHGTLIPVFKCKLCDKIFPSTVALKEHKVKLHKKLDKDANENESPVTSVKKIKVKSFQNSNNLTLEIF